MKRLSATQWWGVAGIFTVQVALLALAIADPFRSTSVCMDCGAERHTTEWRLPFTDITVHKRNQDSDSPLSSVLISNGIVLPHSHQWCSANGSGHGITCSLGRARHILPVVRDEDFAAFVLALHKQGQTGFRDRVLSGVFDPRAAISVHQWSYDAPKGVLASMQMQSWIAAETNYLDELLAKGKKR